jgi:hypothetical protein
MLYTVGHLESYEQYFREQDRPLKMGFVPGYYEDGRDYLGGSVFLTAAEAESVAPSGYGVYGLMTDISNTHEVLGNLHLKKDAELVRLNTLEAARIPHR